MKTDKGRPVAVTYKDRQGKEVKSVGVFKVWAYKIKICNVSKALMMESKAIIETPAGFCVWINPANLQFTDVQ